MRPTTGGTRTTEREGRATHAIEPDSVAAEAREIVCRAIGDAAGLTVKAQLRRATANLGYPADAWRVREAFYGRAGSWSAAALDDLRRRSATWCEGQEACGVEQLPIATEGTTQHHTLAQRLEAIRVMLDEVARQISELAAEVAAIGG